MTHALRLTNKNSLSILASYDLVLDATDNFAARYLLNDACALLGKPLVYGAVSQYEGQVSVFHANAEEQSGGYRDLFPVPPPPGSVLNCAEAGVLNVLPGIIGTMQATEAIKLLTGIGEPLVNKLFTYNALTNESMVFEILPGVEKAASFPQTAAAYTAMDYEWECAAPSPQAEEIEAAAFDALLQQDDVMIIDVREPGEEPAVHEFAHHQMPLSSLAEKEHNITAATVVVFCQSGKRSKEAASLLSAGFGAAKKVLSLKGGIVHWKQLQHGKKT